ncbi:MAG: mechanosensitive ion channel domain-containing protein [Promethearchaeota archaeon]
MKKIYFAILYLILIVLAIVIFIFSGWSPLRINLLIIIIAIFILRKPLKSFTVYLFKKPLYRAISAAIINIFWSIFILWFILDFSINLFIALISFLVVTISFTFKIIINNIASGALILTIEQIDNGDLIETNNIQGTVKEVKLNHTTLVELDGIETYIPNSNIFGSTLIKFSHKRFKTLDPLKIEEIKKSKRSYLRYLNRLQKIINLQKKITRYVKDVEILGSLDPNSLEESLSIVFDKYEKILGTRPEYSVDTIEWERLKMKLYIISDSPQKVVNNIDAFLRDVVFQLYSKDIYEGWEEYNDEHNKITLPYEVNMK